MRMLYTSGAVYPSRGSVISDYLAVTPEGAVLGTVRAEAFDAATHRMAQAGWLRENPRIVVVGPRTITAATREEQATAERLRQQHSLTGLPGLGMLCAFGAASAFPARDTREVFARQLCAKMPLVRKLLRAEGVSAGSTSSTGYRPVSTEGVNISCGDELERDGYWNAQIRRWLKQGTGYAEAQRRRMYPTRLLAVIQVRHPFGANPAKAAAAQQREDVLRVIVARVMATAGLVPHQDGWTLPGGPPAPPPGNG